MLKISLSAGHGQNTPGKRTPDGMREWEFNSAVVKKMVSLLALYENVATLRLDDPSGQVDFSLSERTKRTDAWGADVHIDVHANAYGSDWNDANGIETFVYKFTDKPSKLLADTVQSRLVAATKLKNRGVKEGDLHMVREPKAKTKILVEGGFMTNIQEAALLKSDTYRQTVANSIVDSLVSVYMLKKRVVVNTPPKNELELAREFVKEKGIMTDITRGNEPVTRDQLALILYRMGVK